MFAKWAEGDDSAIYPDLRGAVFAIAVKHGGRKEVTLQLVLILVGRSV
jgi:aminopeptidase 2